MKFLIVTNVTHKLIGNKIYSYDPYVREMNLWIKPNMNVTIIAPFSKSEILNPIDGAFECNRINLINVKPFNMIGFSNIIKALFNIPLICITIFKQMKINDHIHIRCPNNMGLLGCFIQIFFPKKCKTAKYANNWDWKSKQPLSYRLQQIILRNTFLTKNIKTLVYGNWEENSKNIVPFFTSSYSEKLKTNFIKPNILNSINLVFVGKLGANKNPKSAIETLKYLQDKNVNSSLTFCGEGPDENKLKLYCKDLNLVDKVTFLGNISSSEVIEILKQSHYLIFLSNSEGWPKVVAESMWWGCIPISKPVSCIPEMLGYGKRGFISSIDIQYIGDLIINMLNFPQTLEEMRSNGVKWSRKYTLERFESEIQVFLKSQN